MSRKEMRKELNKRNIFNNFDIADFAGKDKVYVTYSKGDSLHIPRFTLYKVGKRFKDAVALNSGLSFIAKNSYDEEELKKALSYACKTSKNNIFIKTPFDGWVSKDTADALNLSFKIYYNANTNEIIKKKKYDNEIF